MTELEILEMIDHETATQHPTLSLGDTELLEARLLEVAEIETLMQERPLARRED